MSALINNEDLKVEVMCPTNLVGQHVGYTITPIKVTHIPTGLVAIAECRSQHKSRQVAIEMIEAALTSPNYR